MKDARVDGLVAVVTGAASGIGAASAERLADQGWKVHGLDLERPAPAVGPTHQVDVTDEEQLRGVADSIGPVDALVTAAGVNLRPHDGPAHKLGLQAWDRTLAVNVTGTMLSIRVFAPLMRDSGSIVTLGSVAGITAMIGADGYTASKGAVIALTRSWAVEYSRYGIRVNCVCPGPTDTSLMQRVLSEVDGQSPIQLPQQRLATPQEVAAVVSFVAHPDSSYLSGTVIPVDGAATANTAGMPFPRRRTRS